MVILQKVQVFIKDIRLLRKAMFSKHSENLWSSQSFLVAKCFHQNFLSGQRVWDGQLIQLIRRWVKKFRISNMYFSDCLMYISLILKHVFLRFCKICFSDFSGQKVWEGQFIQATSLVCIFQYIYLWFCNMYFSDTAKCISQIF